MAARLSKEEWKKKTQERLDGLSNELCRQLEETTQRGSFAEYMRQVGRLPRRSLRNQLLIYSQHLKAYQDGLVSVPEPRMVLGFWDWKQRGRHVMKGQHGYQVLQPVTKRMKQLPDGQWSYVTKDYKAKPNEKVERRVVGFKVGTVFDVCQTEGDPVEVPEPPATVMLDGEPPKWFIPTLKDELERRGFTVHMGKGIDVHDFGIPPWETSVKGFTRYDPSDQIVVVSEASEAQMGAVLAHELGHVLMGHEHTPKTRGVKEVEAEGLAAMLCGMAGYAELPKSWSTPYIAGWANSVSQKDPVGVYKGVLDHINAQCLPVIKKLEDAKEAYETQAAKQASIAPEPTPSHQVQQDTAPSVETALPDGRGPKVGVWPDPPIEPSRGLRIPGTENMPVIGARPKVSHEPTKLGAALAEVWPTQVPEIQR